MTWFSRLRNWTTDASNGIGIRADYHDSEDNNFATGINACLNIAGQNSPTANIPMGGFKLTGLANGSAVTDSATVGQIQTSVANYAVDSSGTDAYAITLSPALTAYSTGQVFRFYPATINTGAATLNINSLGAKTIKKDKNVDLADGDIQVGQLIEVIYDGTNFQMISPPYGILTQNGASIYAADGGASDSYAITLPTAPAAYATGMVVRFKANTKNTGACSINVNSLGAKTIKKDQGADLSDNDIGANQIVEVIYDGTNFQLLSPIFGVVGQNGQSIYAADAGSNDTYVITLSPAPVAYANGMVVRFKANTANTGTCTLNVNSLGAITIKKDGNVDLLDNDIKANQLVELIYDGTNFQMLSPRSNTPTIVSPTAYTVICAGTTSTGALQSVASVGTSGQFFTSNGAASLPTFQTAALSQVILIQTNTSSSSAISEFNGLFSSAYDEYMFVFTNLLPATDATFLRAQLGTGATPTYTTTGYKWNSFSGVSSGSYQSFGSVDGSGTYAGLTADATYGVDNVEGGVSGNFKLKAVSGSSSIAMGYGDITYVQSASTSFYVRTMCGFKLPAATFTAIKFYFDTGNIASGKIAMYGLKNS